MATNSPSREDALPRQSPTVPPTSTPPSAKIANPPSCYPITTPARKTTLHARRRISLNSHVASACLGGSWSTKFVRVISTAKYPRSTVKSVCRGFDWMGKSVWMRVRTVFWLIRPQESAQCAEMGMCCQVICACPVQLPLTATFPTIRENVTPAKLASNLPPVNNAYCLKMMCVPNSTARAAANPACYPLCDWKTVSAWTPSAR